MNESLNSCPQGCDQGCGAAAPKKHVFVTGSVRVEVAVIDSLESLQEASARILDILQMETVELATALSSSSGMTAEGALRVFRGQPQGRELLLTGMGATVANVALLCADQGVSFEELMGSVRQNLTSRANGEVKNLILEELRDRGLE